LSCIDPPHFEHWMSMSKLRLSSSDDAHRWFQLRFEGFELFVANHRTR
jgi:hypothetical protein